MTADELRTLADLALKFEGERDRRGDFDVRKAAARVFDAALDQLQEIEFGPRRP